MATTSRQPGAIRGSTRRARGAALTRFSFGELLAATGARRLRGDDALPLTGVSTDTRTLEPGQLFLALRGPNFDGNRFARLAQQAGAGALLLAGDAAPSAIPEHVAVALH